MGPLDKAYVYNLSGDEYRVIIRKGRYSSGSISMQMFDLADGFPFAKCTVDIPGLKEGEVAIKDYSENEGMLDFLIKNRIVENPHRYEKSGYVSIPICKTVF